MVEFGEESRKVTLLRFRQICRNRDPIDHTAESRAWKLAFDLGRDGANPAMPRDVSPRVRMAFASGLEAGGRARDEDIELESERWQLIDRASGHPHLAEEFREMGMRAPIEG
jgi:hypothetical protein